MAWLGRKPNVGRLARKRDVDGLVKALAYRDYMFDVDGRPIDVGAPVRKAAIIALTELDDPAAREALAGALSDRDPEVRLAAMRTLREAREPAVVEALIDGVLSWPVPPHGEARAEAIEALANTGDPAVPERVATALVRSEDDLGPDSEALLARLLDGASAEAPRRVVGAMARAMKEEGPQVRRNAQQVLQWVAPDSVDALIAALRDPSARGAAATALGTSKDQRAVEPLLGVLTDPDPAVRRAAVWGLGEIRDPRAAEALFRASADSDYGVRSEALAALDKLGTVSVMLAVASSMRPLLRPAGAEGGRRSLGTPKAREGARVAMRRLVNRRREEEQTGTPPRRIVLPGRAGEAERQSEIAASEATEAPEREPPEAPERESAPEPAEPTPQQSEPATERVEAPAASAVRERPAATAAPPARDTDGRGAGMSIPRPAPTPARAGPGPLERLAPRREEALERVRRAADARVPGKLAVGLVLGAVGAGFLVSSLGDDQGPVASAGGVSLSIPDGWRSVDASAPVTGLRFRDPVALAERSDPGSRLVAGFLADGQTLPQQVARRLSVRSRPDAVRLGRFEAYRYSLRGRATSGRPARLYLTPTTAGLVGAVCYSGGRTPGFPGRCERAAASLSVEDATPYPLAGLDGYLSRLDRVARTLNARVAVRGERLRTARGPAQQARAAGQLASAYAAAARDLRKGSVPPQAEGVNGRIIASLGDVSDSYRRLARAARAGSASRYRSARRAVVRAEAALQRIL